MKMEVVIIGILSVLVIKIQMRNFMELLEVFSLVNLEDVDDDFTIVREVSLILQ